MKIQRAELLRLLGRVSSACSKKPRFPQATCVAYKGGELVAFDGEFCCRQAADLGLPAKAEWAAELDDLVKLLAKVPDEEVEVKYAKGQLSVKSRSGKSTKEARLTCQATLEMPLDVLPVPGEKDWRELPEGFPDLLAAACGCVSNEGAKRWVLTLVHFTPAHVESWDRRQLIRCRAELPVPELLAVARACSLAAREGVREVATSPDWLHFRTADGLTVSCRTYADVEDFEPAVIDEVLAAAGEPVELPEGLAEACSRAALFSDDAHGKVRVSLSPGRVGVTGSGAGRSYEEGWDVPYSGAPLAFGVSAGLLARAAARGGVCTVTPRCLKLEGPDWSYATTLERG